MTRILALSTAPPVKRVFLWRSGHLIFYAKKSLQDKSYLRKGEKSCVDKKKAIKHDDNLSLYIHATSDDSVQRLRKKPCLFFWLLDNILKAMLSNKITRTIFLNTFKLMEFFMSKGRLVHK